MCGQTSEERSRSLATKASRYSVSRRQPRHSKTRHKQWIPWNKRNRTQHCCNKLSPMVHERPEEAIPCQSIDAKGISRLIYVPFQHDSSTIIERMCEWSGRENPLQAMVCERQ